jgi:hypothetical protein
MRLNINKCKIMIINNGRQMNQPNIVIENQALEIVPTYKYLGITLNNKLEWDKQWNSISTKINTVPYLVKRLKYLGFRKSILLTVYNSYALSHIRYSAPLLTNCSTSIIRELESFNKRILRIIGVQQQEITNKYDIPTPQELIDEHCTKTMKRVLTNSNHPLTRKLSSNLKAKFKFRHPIPKSAAYSNSFVPKYLAAVRDGTVDLYKCGNTTKNKMTNNPLIASKETAKQRCHICNKEFIRVKTHISRMHKNN